MVTVGLPRGAIAGLTDREHRDRAWSNRRHWGTDRDTERQELQAACTQTHTVVEMTDGNVKHFVYISYSNLSQI